jgi:transposase
MPTLTAVAKHAAPFSYSLTRLLDEHIDRHRWRIERALSWLSCFRRLQVRWDRDAGRWFALVLLACAVVCFNRL